MQHQHSERNRLQHSGEMHRDAVEMSGYTQSSVVKFDNSQAKSIGGRQRLHNANTETSKENLIKKDLKKLAS